MAWILIIIGIGLLFAALIGAYITRKRGPADSQEKIDSIVNDFDINDWPVVSGVKNVQIRSVAKQAEARTRLVNAVADLESTRGILHARGMETERAYVDHQNYLLDASLRGNLTQLALQSGLDVPTLMTLVQKERFNELDVQRLVTRSTWRRSMDLKKMYQLRKEAYQKGNNYTRQELEQIIQKYLGLKPH